MTLVRSYAIDRTSRSAISALDLSRFDAAPLMGITATKETDYTPPGRVMGSMTPRGGLKRTDEYSDHKFNIAPNLLDRDFNADAPNQKWASDISYVWTIDQQHMLAGVRGA